MEWQPEDQYWLTYVNFEMRYKEIDRARGIFERFVYVHPEIKNWLKYAKFEQRAGFLSSARSIYEKAIDFFGEEYMDENLFIGFAQFEESQKEHERARVIYKYALDKMPKGQLISKIPFGVFKSPKKTEIFSRISDLASKKRSNQINKGTLHC